MKFILGEDDYFPIILKIPVDSSFESSFCGSCVLLFFNFLGFEALNHEQCNSLLRDPLCWLVSLNRILADLCMDDWETFHLTWGELSSKNSPTLVFITTTGGGKKSKEAQTQIRKHVMKDIGKSRRKNKKPSHFDLEIPHSIIDDLMYEYRVDKILSRLPLPLPPITKRLRM
jgi:hypothetical protein